MENKQKIIEVYATLNKEKDEVTIEFERIIDNDISNSIMKYLMKMYSNS